MKNFDFVKLAKIDLYLMFTLNRLSIRPYFSVFQPHFMHVIHKWRFFLKTPWHTKYGIFFAYFTNVTLGMSSYEEFLWKVIFRKVLIMLNILIFYHFFISLIVLNLSGFEISLETLFFWLESLKKVTLRVSGKDSSWAVKD